jgi:CubicO group peptidase (beta-lactamase class C family)
MAMYDRTRGFEIDSLRSTPTEAAALLRGKLTGRWESLAVQVEPEPPHRIVGDAASLAFAIPKSTLADVLSDAERVREIDRIARRLSEADAFSGVVLLARGDSTLYLSAFGQADRERNVPMDPQMRFDLASIPKTFVTVAIAKLVEEGKLSWEDPIGKYLPDFPLVDARQKVRIRHLVTHSSGLQDVLRYCEHNPCPRARSMDDFVRTVALAQEDSLLYTPGTRSPYTNANFLLLGKILEVVSGEPYYDYIRTNVFQPAGMKDTDFYATGVLPERIAIGYDKQYASDGVRFQPVQAGYELVGYPSPDGAAYSTAGDLVRFARALRAGHIMRPETVAILFAPKPEAGSWGYGFDILDEVRGLTGHGGTGRGASNSLDMFTRTGYTAVILSNYSYARSPLREVIWELFLD